MLCNWCHKVIPAGEELKEQDRGRYYSYTYLHEGTGGGESEGSFIGGGYYHRLCYWYKALSNLKGEREQLWKGRWKLWIFLWPVLIIVYYKKKNRQKKLDKAIREIEEIIAREEDG